MKRRLFGMMLACVLFLAACGQAANSSAEESQESAAAGTAQVASEDESNVEESAAAEAESEAAAQAEAEAAAAEAKAAEEEAMYTGYLGILQSEKSAIDNYNWQMTFLDDEETRWELTAGSNKKHIALADVYGDERPELIFMSAPMNEQGFAFAADLTIMTYDAGSFGVLYSDRMDVLAGGGVYYALFRMEGEQYPALYISYLEEYTNSYFRKFDILAESQWFNYREILEEGVGPDETYENEVRETYVEGEEVSAEEYDAAFAEQLSKVESVLMYSGVYDEAVMNCITEKPNLAMSYEEAIAELKARGAKEEELSADEGTAIFSMIPSAYTFASGVGGWSTQLTIYPDGTFAGSYSDSDMGDNSSEYPNGTVYVSECMGKFTNVQQVSENCYSMELTELSLETPAEETWIQDGTRYISSTPYGISESGEASGQIFMIYLAGIETEVLPLEYLDWVGMPSAKDYSTEETMPISGIYNTVDQTGFFAQE